VDVDRSPAPLAALLPSYRPIFDRLLAVCENDERIRAFWLSGSLAKDTTTGCERLDVVSEAVSKVPTSRHRYRRVVFDRDGLDAAVPAPEPPPGPNLDRLRSTVEEFFRVEAIVPVMLNQRRDYLAAVNGVQSLQLMLYNVFVECNQPQPPMGIKQWTARLTPEQRQVLTALPVAAPEHDSIAVGLRATGNAMRIPGRAAVTACGGTWPVDLDEGVQRFVDQSVPAP
jgi:hypothetical protein